MGSTQIIQGDAKYTITRVIRGREGGRASCGCGPADTLISDSWSLEPRENQSLC